MSKTVKQISESLGVNRSVVYRAIKNLNIEPESLSDGANGSGTTLYSDESIKAVRDEIKRIKAKHESKGKSESIKQEQSDILIDALKETIRTQSEMIEHLRTENIELREMLKREQDIRVGLIAIEARTGQDKPRLSERIKSKFKRNKSENEHPAPSDLG